MRRYLWIIILISVSADAWDGKGTLAYGGAQVENDYKKLFGANSKPTNCDDRARTAQDRVSKARPLLI